MARKLFDPKDCIANLNNMKNAMQIRNTPISKENLVKGLIGCGLPANSNFWTIFKKSGIIKKEGNGYIFASKEPIFVGLLENIRNKYQELLRKYKKSSNKNKEAEVVCQELIKHKDPIESAIELLQQHGYQIFAPVGVIYKKL